MATTTTTPAEGTSDGRGQRVVAAGRPSSGQTSPWRATGREPPVFLDERGRRGLLVRAFGLLGALASAAAVTFVVVGALAFVHVSPLSRGSHSIYVTHAAGRSQSPPRGASADRMPARRPERLTLFVRGTRPGPVVGRPQVKARRAGG
jgi:hypothetical protein